MNKKWVKLFAISLLVVLLISGCTSNNNTEKAEGEKRNVSVPVQQVQMQVSQRRGLPTARLKDLCSWVQTITRKI